MTETKTRNATRTKTKTNQTQSSKVESNTPTLLLLGLFGAGLFALSNSNEPEKEETPGPETIPSTDTDDRALEKLHREGRYLEGYPERFIVAHKGEVYLFYWNHNLSEPSQTHELCICKAKYPKNAQEPYWEKYNENITVTNHPRASAISFWLKGSSIDWDPKGEDGICSTQSVANDWFYLLLEEKLPSEVIKSFLEDMKTKLNLIFREGVPHPVADWQMKYDEHREKTHKYKHLTHIIYTQDKIYLMSRSAWDTSLFTLWEMSKFTDEELKSDTWKYGCGWTRHDWRRENLSEVEKPNTVPESLWKEMIEKSKYFATLPKNFSED